MTADFQCIFPQITLPTQIGRFERTVLESFRNPAELSLAFKAVSQGAITPDFIHTWCLI